MAQVSAFDNVKAADVQSNAINKNLVFIIFNYNCFCQDFISDFCPIECKLVSHKASRCLRKFKQPSHNNIQLKRPLRCQRTQKNDKTTHDGTFQQNSALKIWKGIFWKILTRLKLGFF